MKQHSIYKHITAAVVVVASCLALSSVPVSAEKNVTGMPLSFAKYNNVKEKWMPWYIYVKPGEKAVARFTVIQVFPATGTSEAVSGKFTMYGPDGNVVSGQQKAANGSTHGLPGNTDSKPFEVLLESPVATEAGVYAIQVESNKSTPKGQHFRMDWAIGATKTTADKIILGRVWATHYKVINQSIHQPVPGYLANLPLYYVSEEGHHYKAEYRGYMGIDSTFATNKYGIIKKNADCESAYRSQGDRRARDKDVDLLSVNSQHCGGQYKVFFAEPASDLPKIVKLPNGQTTWLNNEIKNTSIENMKFVSANDNNVPLKGEVTATIKNYTGNTTLLVDTNGNKKFNDPEDRKIIFNTEGEQAKYLFDGKDEQGKVIPEGVRVAFRIDADKKGEIHFIRNDAEISKGGISVKRLNGSPKKRSILYWNDSHFSNKKCGNWSIEPMNNDTGVDSTGGVHSWDAEECVVPPNSGWESGMPSNGNTNPEWSGEKYWAASSWGDNRYIDDWTYDEGSARSSIIFYSAPPPEEPQPEQPTPKAPNTGAAQLVANGTKALPWLLGAGAIAYYLRRRS